MKLVTNMKKLVTAALAMTAIGFTQALDQERDLQAIGRVRVTQGLTSYPDDLQITFNSNLKCGACIRGGYIYCVNGYEEDIDLAKKPATCC